MTRQTLTQKIFQTGCPYGNQYQGSSVRIVFVCSVGMLRSPTAQMVATGLGFNARACGSDTELALIPLSCNLIDWAQHVVFMNSDNFEEALQTFAPVGYDVDIKQKAIVWDIRDDYNYGDNVLWNICHHKLQLIDSGHTI